MYCFFLVLGTLKQIFHISLIKAVTQRELIGWNMNTWAASVMGNSKSATLAESSHSHTHTLWLLFKILMIVAWSSGNVSEISHKDLESRNISLTISLCAVRFIYTLNSSWHHSTASLWGSGQTSSQGCQSQCCHGYWRFQQKSSSAGRWHLYPHGYTTLSQLLLFHLFPHCHTFPSTQLSINIHWTGSSVSSDLLSGSYGVCSHQSFFYYYYYYWSYAIVSKSQEMLYFH